MSASWLVAGNPLAAPQTLVKQPTDGAESFCLDLSGFIGLYENVLRVVAFGSRNIHCNANWNEASFHGADQALLAAFEEHHEIFDPSRCAADLLRDFFLRIVTLAKPGDLLDDIDRPMLTACDMLDEAHYQAIAFWRSSNNGRNLGGA